MNMTRDFSVWSTVAFVFFFFLPTEYIHCVCSVFHNMKGLAAFLFFTVLLATTAGAITEARWRIDSIHIKAKYKRGCQERWWMMSKLPDRETEDMEA